MAVVNKEKKTSKQKTNATGCSASLGGHHDAEQIRSGEVGKTERRSDLYMEKGRAGD